MLIAYLQTMKEVKIEESWKLALSEEFEKPYFSALISFIKEEKNAGKIIYPPGPQIFNAFDGPIVGSHVDQPIWDVPSGI